MLSRGLSLPPPAPLLHEAFPLMTLSPLPDPILRRITPQKDSK